MATKRPQSASAASSSTLVKRTRVEDGDASSPSTSLVPISSAKDGKDKGLVRSVKRTSRLSDPILSLSGGHRGEILDVRYSPGGQYIAAAGGDRAISIWRTYSPNDHITSLTSHGKAVTCLCWVPSTSSSPLLLSGSADSTIILWSPLASTSTSKVRRFRYHRSIVNAVAASPTDSTLFASGSDDGSVCVWKTDEKKPLEVLRVGYSVTALEWTGDGSGLFIGGLDNQIHLYDLHRKRILYSLAKHTDTITSLRISPSGSHLLSFSHDSNLYIWDVRPFAISTADTSSTDSSSAPTAAQERHSKTLTGALGQGVDLLLVRATWSKDGKRVVCGSADRTCLVWDVESGKILYKLPGHRGTVTAADIHPKEPIVLSASTDGQLYLGEIEP